MAHTPVLLQAVLSLLDPRPGDVFLDGTVGSGGHAASIANCLGPSGRLIALDQDANSLAQAREALRLVPARIDLVLANFRDLAVVLDRFQVPAVGGILFDLGARLFLSL